ncbi:MAG TPA: hypothetical protein PLP25_10405 [Candidatus Limiplasma sp.]|nr:hypothetical protein [Candidatus Limiplasma sp.]HPS82252.1 hypothetical protein [Candidatus Limiplasma sp.]
MMLYTETDRATATAEQQKRRRLVLWPTAVLFALAIATFVWFRLHRDVGGWVWTGLLTVLSGAYFLFFYEVYLRPVTLYRQHIDYMLDGRKRETVGVLTAVDKTVRDKDGIDCMSFTVNTGNADRPEDDRLFYLDALKEMPDIPIGAQVHVLSNDRMVAGLTVAPKER